MFFAKLEPDRSNDDIRRRHALVDPELPSVYCCASLVNKQFKEPELFRNELVVIFSFDSTDEPIAERCLFFCARDEDTSKGKAVLGRFNISKNGERLECFKKLTSDSCGQKVTRPLMKDVYCCTLCDERLCEICSEAIAFELLKRLQMLCLTQPNLNHWCHGVRSSTRWHVPASKTEMGDRLTGWTWEWLCKQRIPYGEYIFDVAEGWRVGSAEIARLRQRTVRQHAPPPVSQSRARRHGDQLRRR